VKRQVGLLLAFGDKQQKESPAAAELEIVEIEQGKDLEAGVNPQLAVENRQRTLIVAEWEVAGLVRVQVQCCTEVEGVVFAEFARHYRVAGLEQV
jgi:hypothetical protein